MAKVLLIDDDQSIGELFSYSLKKSGFDTILAMDGKSGIDKAKIENVDLILLDEVLPDIPGNEILKTLKTDTKTQIEPDDLVARVKSALSGQKDQPKPQG